MPRAGWMRLLGSEGWARIHPQGMHALMTEGLCRSACLPQLPADACLAEQLNKKRGVNDPKNGCKKARTWREAD